MTATCDENLNVDKASTDFSWDFAFSDKTFLTCFLVFLGCALFSSAANGVLLFLTVRFKQHLWQTQYILIKCISACGLGTSSVTALVVLSAVVRRHTQIYGYWCIAQFCVLRCFFLTSQMTLALMALERYVFISHGINYLRMLSTRNIHISMALVWLISGAASFHGGSVLSRFQCGFKRQTSGLLCDALTIKEHITFSWEDDKLMFVLPSVITTLCVLAICYCFGCICRATLRVNAVLKCANRRVTCTVGLYFVMFLLHLAKNISFVISKVTVSFTVMPLLIVIPPGTTAAFLLLWNPQIRRLLFSVCRSSAAAEVRSDGSGEHARQPEPQGQVEREDMELAAFDLPGSVGGL